MNLGNWIRATTATTGTGSLTLSSASGYATPGSQFAQAERFSYVLLSDSDGKPVEAGIGYLDSGGLLVREVVQATYSGSTYTDATTNAGLTASSLTGTTRVICSHIKTSAHVPTRRGRPSGTQANDIFHPANLVSPATGSLGVSSNSRSYYMPVLLDFAFPVDAVAIYIGTTTGNHDLGLYGVAANGDPGDLLIGWENKTTTTNSLNAFTLASATVGRWSAATRIIPPGWYYWHWNTASGSQNYSRLFALHQVSLIPQHDLGARTTVLIVNRTQGTLATTAPSSMSQATVSGSSDVVNVPLIGFRRAS
jgi:hypothetical protein